MAAKPDSARARHLDGDFGPMKSSVGAMVSSVTQLCFATYPLQSCPRDSAGVGGFDLARLSPRPRRDRVATTTCLGGGSRLPHSNEQMYSAMPAGTRMEKPLLPGT